MEHGLGADHPGAHRPRRLRQERGAARTGYRWLATAEGWAAFTPDGRYKTAGNLAGGLWVALGLCRFEPGEPF